MCRWIAYAGKTIALEHYVTDPAHSLVSQSLKALESTATVNGDGFGLGWYGGGHTEPGRYRDLQPAWSDDNLRSLCRHLSSHIFFAHVRAATDTPVNRPNCHPFACGPWLFMHNGFVADWPRLRRGVEALITDELYTHRLGTTDSEALFLAILAAGLAGGVSDVDPITATVRTLAAITTMVEGKPLLFTSALSDGRDLYCFRFGANHTANTMYYRATEEGTVVVSEPLDREAGRWITVPENHVLISRWQKPVEVLPLSRFGLGEAVEAERLRA